MIRDLIRTETDGFSQENLPDLVRTNIVWVPLSRIRDNPYQPRQEYDPMHVLNIAQSIASLKGELRATLGLQQMPMGRVGTFTLEGFVPAPKLVYSDPTALRRMLAERAGVQLMFGHSRLRAFRVLAHGALSVFPDFLKRNLVAPPDIPNFDADYEVMPILLGFADDQQMWKHAITENSQRKDINPIEEAAAMQKAIAEFGYTYEQAAAPFGYQAKGTISNKIRLLNLPAEVQRDIAAGKLTERHGRELLRLADDPKLLSEAYTEAIKKGKTVAQLTEDVNWRAKQLKELQEAQRELAIAQEIIAGGYTPPGSSAPLPADRVPVLSGYRFDSSDDKKLLRTGLCGAHCPCCTLVYTSYSPEHTIRPDPERAPHMGVGCTGGFETRRAKLDALEKIKAQKGVEMDEAERQVMEERARRLAQREDLERQAHEKWNAWLLNLNHDLWTDLRFWRTVGKRTRLYSIENFAQRSQSISELQSVLLQQLLESAEVWSNELGLRAYDMGIVDSIIAELAHVQPLPAQPKPGDSQKTGWEDGWSVEDRWTHEDITSEITCGDSSWTELPELLDDYGEELAPRVLLRLIEDCPDKAVRGELWRRYNKLADVGKEAKRQSVSPRHVEDDADEYDGFDEEDEDEDEE